MRRIFTPRLIVALLLPGLAGCIISKDPYVYNPHTLIGRFDSESPQVYNVHTVEPGILIRGAQPDDEKGVRALRDHFGIKTIINLNDHPNKDEPKYAADLGIAYVPLPDDPFNEEEDRDLHLALLKAIHTAQRNGPVYVHCATGSDRAGLAVALYRVVDCGWDAATALAELRQHQPYYMAVFFYHYPDMLREAEKNRTEWLRTLDAMPDPPIQPSAVANKN